MVVIEAVSDSGTVDVEDSTAGLLDSLVFASEVDVELDWVDTIGIVEVVMVHLLFEQWVVVTVVVEIVTVSGVAPGIVSLAVDEVSCVTAVMVDGVVTNAEVVEEDTVPDVKVAEVNVLGVTVADVETLKEDVSEVEDFDIE